MTQYQRRLLIGGLLVVIVGVIGFGLWQRRTPSAPAAAPSPAQPTATTTAAPATPSAPAAPQAPARRTYTMADVARHATPEDCWIVIAGTVYDVSGFGAKHPGGAAVYQGCGTDATRLFETRPMGSGTPHSAKARTAMGRFAIGTIVKEQ